ncbi:MAG: DinB family protein [Bryobacteraceae bacterium]
MNPEPWLRGTLKDTNPLISPVLYSFQQAREDLAAFTAGLSGEQTWARPAGLAPVGFQIRHIAGSVDRLMTYAQGTALSEAQLDTLKRELDPGEPLVTLLSTLDQTLREAETVIRQIDPVTYTEARTVGRKALPTTVIGLLIHIAEHTQRHVGQAIVTSKIVRAAL